MEKQGHFSVKSRTTIESNKAIIRDENGAFLTVADEVMKMWERYFSE